MVEITVFRVNNQEDKLEITMNTQIDETIQELRLWTQDTFKNYELAIDLSSKLVQSSNTEILTITASEISEESLTGIYFIEAVDSTESEECIGCSNTVLGVASDFSRFQYCITEYLCKLKIDCPDCNKELGHALTLKLYIDGMKNSLQLGKFNVAIMFWRNLNVVCKSNCVQCDKISYITKKGLGFQTLNNDLILY